MAVYFELIDRSTGEIVLPVEVDNRMRAAWALNIDKENWLANWYNCFGISLACGDSWEQVKEDWELNPAVVAVAQYLESVYQVRSWRE